MIRIRLRIKISGKNSSTASADFLFDQSHTFRYNYASLWKTPAGCRRLVFEFLFL
jgi:hypothetical protein